MHIQGRLGWTMLLAQLTIIHAVYMFRLNVVDADVLVGR